MNIGFYKADSTNLPRIDADMVNAFYINNLQYFSSEMKNVKTQKSSRDAYGDNAISYVQLKREHDVCIVRAKITPEHKVHKKAYTVEVIINENDDKVLNCSCSDCAAALGGCKHAIAFLFWLHRRSEEPSVTSVECYWKASKLSKVGTSEKFMTINEIAGTICPIQRKNPELIPQFLQNVGTQEGGLFDFFKEHELENLDIFQLILKYKCQQVSPSADDFIQFLKKYVTNTSLCEEKTRSQANCLLWYKMRFGRITASKIYEAAKCKTKEGSLLESTMGATKQFETKATSRGKELEPFVIKEVEKIKKIKINSVGLILSSDYPVFGASPDGINENYCIEIKCPYNEKSIERYVKNNVISPKYYFQLQMQMLFANKEKALFCVASHNFTLDKVVYIFDVHLNKEEVIDIINLAEMYWKNCVFEYLIKM